MRAKEIVDGALNRSEVAARLSRAGYSKLDSGEFSTVYGKAESNLVVKLTDPVDTAWEIYAKLCLKSKNKHLLRVYSFSETEGINDVPGGVIVTVAERLLKLRPGEYPLGIGEYGDFLVLDTPDSKGLAESFPDRYPSLAKAMRFISKSLNKEFEFDLGNVHNVMKREDGTLVLSDPIV